MGIFYQRNPGYSSPGIPPTRLLLQWQRRSRAYDRHPEKADIDIGVLGEKEMPESERYMIKAPTYQHRLKTLNEAVKIFKNSELSENDYQGLIGMINQRNELSHIYNQNAFEKIHKSLPFNLKIIKKCARIID